MFCSNCGKQISEQANMCTECGHPIKINNRRPHDPNASDKSRLVTILLYFFLDGIGIHLFYVGKTGTGIAQILTLGGLGIWALVDLIMIATGSFSDSEGKMIKNWELS